MVIRRLIVAGAALGLLVATAAPVAAVMPANPDGYSVNVLVTGPSPDADLVNAWGLSRLAGSPWWVADNGTNQSTLYNADGTKRSLIVAIPGGAPTGTVSNANAAAGDFHGDLFLFDSEAGIISGWRGALGTTAEVGNDHAWDGAVFKGLTIGMADVGSGSQQYIYATDFHNRKVDVFDKTFTEQTWTGAFQDPHLSKDYAPFGIQNLNGKIFVTYAKTQAGSNDEMAGQGRGLVDAYATDGSFLGRVVSHGQLNAPWGLAWAPADFGRFSNDLLVGNFGDGTINAYAWTSDGWEFAGTLKDSAGKPVFIDGLWAIAFGGDTANNGAHNQLFFAAGPNDESAGAFGTVEADNP